MMPVTFLFNSLNRRVWLYSCQRISGFHFPPMTLRVIFTGEPLVHFFIWFIFSNYSTFLCVLVIIQHSVSIGLYEKNKSNIRK